MDVAAYLARICYSGPMSPTAETLRQIHRAHLLAVPFENLDIAIGRKIVIDTEAFIHKIVQERRGGFCYELNGAFAALLEALGFKVTLLSARVQLRDGSEGPEFDHLTLRVDLEEPWLADVGFGDFILDPLRMPLGLEQKHESGVFRIVQEAGDQRVQKLQADGSWAQQYRFTLQPRRLEEFAEMCYYHQTSPESHFTRNSICSLAMLQGRITLADRKLIETNNGVRQERVLTSDEDWRQVLADKFGVRLAELPVLQREVEKISASERRM